MKHGRIAWLGRTNDLPDAPDLLADEVESLDGTLVTPGLIDCHTHLVFGGDRADEFDLRLNGASYEEIARAGGGIVSTVAATRAASEDALYAQALPRAQTLLADGATTLEIKSGYGLELDSERRMLRVARRLGRELGISVRTSFLGLHALPAEYRDRREDYVALVCDEMLPTLAGEGLVDAVDAFCENIGFTLAETRRLFDRARELGLPVKLHAEQLSDRNGAALVAEFGGQSADHLEHLGEAGAKAMVAAGMACTLFRLTPEEALRGVTVHAARALGFSDRGNLATGQRADLVVWNARRPAELCYWIGGNLARRIYVGGELASRRKRSSRAASAS